MIYNITMFSRKNVFWILAILGVVVFFFTRLYHILSLPIFTDEAIYVRWSQIARFDGQWRFISLTDGKQPMFVWVAMTLLRIIKDPLLASRLVSVGCGFVTAIGLYFLGSETFKNKWVGLISALFYVIYPFGLVYDRMALYDSMVGTFAVWTLYVEILLVRRINATFAFLAGLVIGGAVLTKTSGFFGIYLLPFSLILFDFGKKDWKSLLLKWCGLAILVTGLTYLYYSILRLSPFFHIINEKNTTFVYSLKEWLEHPLRFFWGNLLGEWSWLHIYMTPPVAALTVASFFIQKKFLREKFLMLVWFGLPILALALFGKVLYPRFILFMTLPLIPLIADTLIWLYGKAKTIYIFAIICLIIFAMPLWSDYLILTDFAHAHIPKSDLGQYNNDWPAGGGVKEAIKFFNEQAKDKKIYVATEGTFGLLPYAFEMYLESNPNIKIQGYWPIEYPVYKELLSISEKTPTYFVFYQPCIDCPNPGLAPTTWPMKKVYQFEKTRPNRFLTIYKVER